MNALDQVLQDEGKTALCVGPLTLNIVESAIEFTQAEKIPLILIASRRQIECEELGGGYANNWTTEAFSKFIHERNAPNIFLARDHGGPNQGSYENEHCLNVEQSMAMAKRSFEADIKAGIQFIHIDPSLPIGDEKLTDEMILNRLFELYAHVCEYAQSNNKEIQIELGTEEQTGLAPDADAFEAFLIKTLAFAKQHKLKLPLFLVAQTGTKVYETKNFGVFEKGHSSDRTKTVNLIRKLSNFSKKNGVFLKEHNIDYLSTTNLSLRPSLGIKAANVAPEFGVIETRGILHLLHTYTSSDLYEEFVKICFDSKKWEKWLAPNSTADRLEKAVIAGHYCQTNPSFIKIKNELTKVLQTYNIDLDQFLKRNIYAALYRYALAFGLLK